MQRFYYNYTCCTLIYERIYETFQWDFLNSILNLYRKEFPNSIKNYKIKLNKRGRK